MPFLVMIHATFDNLTDAMHVFDESQSVASGASVQRIGQSGERTSHAGVYDEQTDGTLIPVARWHIDRFGIARIGAPIPNNVTPSWIQPAGLNDKYPILDVFGNPTRVSFAGSVWENTVAENDLAPDQFGWDLVT